MRSICYREQKSFQSLQIWYVHSHKKRKVFPFVMTMVFMSVNKKELILIFCKVLCHGFKREKSLAPQRPVLLVQFFVRAECFAYVPGHADATVGILLENLGTLIFTMIY